MLIRIVRRSLVRSLFRGKTDLMGNVAFPVAWSVGTDLGKLLRASGLLFAADLLMSSVKFIGFLAHDSIIQSNYKINY